LRAWSRRTKIYTISQHESVRIRDAASGKERATLRGHTDVVTDGAVGPNGVLIVSTAFDRTLRIWDIASGAERRIEYLVPIFSAPGYPAVMDSGSQVQTRRSK
jgi:WD40 repeat protein